MSRKIPHTVFLAAALGLHTAALFGLRLGAPVFISEADIEPEATEVTLVATAPTEAVAEPPVTPPAPPPEPPPDAMPEPTAAPVPPEQPKPFPKSAPKKPASAARSSAPPPMPGSPLGAGGAPSGKPHAGDNSHATWRHRVTPNYPESARVARLMGSVQVQISVNALGQPASARVIRSSGNAAIDATALHAARSSTFNPKRFAGIPLPDTIIVPYTFRLDGR